MGYHDPREFWARYHRAKKAMAAINALPAPARRRTRAAYVRWLLRHQSDLADRLEHPEEKALVEEAYFSSEMARRRSAGVTTDAETDAGAIEELLVEFLGPFRSRARRP